jgi:signal transduction histidine kinase
LGFISSNLTTLAHYIGDLLELVDACGEAEPRLPAEIAQALAGRRQAMDLPFVREDVPTLIDESRRGVERVRVIVRNLLDFSRSLDESVVALDVHALLDEALAVAWDELQPKVELVKDYGDLPVLEGMPTQLRQVFANLLRNALQSMPNGGCLTLSTTCVDDGIAIAFRDGGCGIAADVQRRVFDPFFTTRPVGKGTGLGLSVAHGIVARHGGRIELVSAPGEGSTFTVWLPLKYKAPG